MKIQNLLFASLMVLTGCTARGCGLSQVNNETVGYVKYIVNERPLLFCPDHTTVNIDMKTPGVVTSEYVTFVVHKKRFLKVLNEANKLNKQVKITSDERRFTWCTPADVIKNVTLLE